MKRKMSLPNARRLYLRRARDHATVADMARIIAVYR
jgi:hypothetical protein